MLGKRFLASAYVTVLSYSLSCGLTYGGESIQSISSTPLYLSPPPALSLAINTPREIRVQSVPTTKLKEITVTGNSIDNGLENHIEFIQPSVRPIIDGNISPHNWGKLSSEHLRDLKPEHLKIRGVNLFNWTF